MNSGCEDNSTFNQSHSPVRSFRLIDFIGRKLQLIEQPDGCTTSFYPVVLGESYLIVGTAGSVFEVDIPHHGIGLLHYERFNLKEH